MGGTLVVTADHGNAEMMRDPETGEPHTAHTLNPVPFIVVNPPGAVARRRERPARRCRADPARHSRPAAAGGDDRHSLLHHRKRGVRRSERRRAARRWPARRCALLLAATLRRPDAPRRQPPSDLDAVRRECIAAARETPAARPGDRDVARIRSTCSAATPRRAGAGLDESRREQAHLLGVLEFLARNPPDRLAAGDRPPIDRICAARCWSSAAVPALARPGGARLSARDRPASPRCARQIDGETERVDGSAERPRTAAPAWPSLSASAGRCFARCCRADSGAAARVARLGREAKDIGDLIKRADAATSAATRRSSVRARAALPKDAAAMVTADNADPTRPAGLRAFDPPQSALLPPVSGTIDRPSGAADAAGAGKSRAWAWRRRGERSRGAVRWPGQSTPAGSVISGLS